MRTRIISFYAGLSTLVGALLAMPQAAVAQGISFEGDLPRAMVFIQEEGRGKVSSREMTSFLLEAGFPIIDPALAIDEAAQALVAAALNGNDAARYPAGPGLGRAGAHSGCRGLRHPPRPGRRHADYGDRRGIGARVAPGPRRCCLDRCPERAGARGDRPGGQGQGDS